MRGGSVKAMGPARLYNRLVKAGIGPDHWQMHATREVLVSRLLSKEGRKDFDLDLLLEHANCAARLAPDSAFALADTLAAATGQSKPPLARSKFVERCPSPTP